MIDATNRLAEIAEVQEISPVQGWLMFHLLQGWNRSGRNETWNQTTKQLCLRTSLQRNALVRARSKLVDLGLIEYTKGRKGLAPEYKLCGVWFLSLKDTESEHKVGHKVGQYMRPCTEKEKEKEINENEAELCPGETENPGNPEPEISGSQLTTRVQGLRDHWSGPLTHLEQSALFQNRELFKAYPWELVSRWLESGPECPPNNRLRFLESGGVTEIGRAREWESESGSHHSPGSWKQKAATLCPQITGGQVVDRLQDSRAERLTRLVAKGKMGLEEAQRTWKQG